MEITFQNTIDLERKAYKEIQEIIYTEQSVNGLVQYLVILYWLSVTTAIMFFTIAVFSPQKGAQNIFSIVSMMLFIALAANHFFLRITNFAHQASTQKTFKQEGEITVLLTENGLKETTENYDMFFDWKILKRIYATKTTFYIMFNGITLYIPLSAFNCPEILNRFALEMEDLSHSEIIKLKQELVTDEDQDE